MDVKTRFLVISDTHAEELPNPQLLPPVDVAIHCGDLTEESKPSEFHAALRLLREIKAPLKLVIAGNHDLTMDVGLFEEKIAEANRIHGNGPSAISPELIQKDFEYLGEPGDLFRNARNDGIIFLQEGVHDFNLANGARLRVFASPSTGSLTGEGGAFQYQIDEGHNYGMSRQDSVDIVMTHGPLRGSGKRAGCQDLFAAVATARPRMHCFGHIHEGWGAKLVTWRGEHVISEMTPSHFTEIDNDESVVVETLGGLKPGKWDTPEMVAEKEGKVQRYVADGYCKAGFCSGDGKGIRLRMQTLFVNAAIQGLEENQQQLPWVVEIDLPLAPQLY